MITMSRYMIAAYNYSLEEIEGRLFCRVMRAKYPRKSDQYKAPEPRVHFALSLGCISSPKIRIYTAQNLETELEAAAWECAPRPRSIFQRIAPAARNAFRSTHRSPTAAPCVWSHWRVGPLTDLGCSSRA